MTSVDFLGLENKRILIAGASGDIGRATAIEASKYGAKIALLGRNEETLKMTRAKLEGSGHVVVPYDLNELDGIPAAVGAVSELLGGLDTIVHCAGAHATQSVRDLNSRNLRSLFELNVMSGMLLTKGFRDRRITKINPSVVFLASSTGLAGTAGASAYSATKGAIISMTRSLAVELAQQGIRVNCVAPGLVESEIANGISESVGEENFLAISRAHPLGLGLPIDVAKAILFLVSDASRWMTGSCLVLDGGYTAQ